MAAASRPFHGVHGLVDLDARAEPYSSIHRAVHGIVGTIVASWRCHDARRRLRRCRQSPDVHRNQARIPGTNSFACLCFETTAGCTSARGLSIPVVDVNARNRRLWRSMRLDAVLIICSAALPAVADVGDVRNDAVLLLALMSSRCTYCVAPQGSIERGHARRWARTRGCMDESGGRPLIMVGIRSGLQFRRARRAGIFWFGADAAAAAGLPGHAFSARFNLIRGFQPGIFNTESGNLHLSEN